MIYVLLPAYNEEKGLPEVLSKIEALIHGEGLEARVVVVDDGSSDATSAAAESFVKRLDLKLIRFQANRGVRWVFQEGFRFVCQDSRKPESDICVVLDSDNTQDPGLMLQLCGRIHAGDDIAIASRFEGDGGMVGCPWHRSFLSYGVSWLMRICVGVRSVRDYSSFYRAYRVSLLQRGFEAYGDRLCDGKGFDVAAGVLIKLARLGARISEVPMKLRYDLKGGQSGMKIIKTMRGYLSLIWNHWTGKQLPEGKPDLVSRT